MKINQMVNLDEEIISNPKFRELKRTKQLSRIINNFLKTHLNIVNEVANKDIEELQDKLGEINVKKAIITEKIKVVEELAEKKKNAEAEEAAKWKIMK